MSGMLKSDIVDGQGMDKTITVVGTGVSYAAPDSAVVSGEMMGTFPDYAGAVKASAGALTSLRKAIGDAGFDMDDLKTTRFSVDTVYRNTSSGAAEFAGYRFYHGISITIEADGESLGKLLQAMISCDGAPEFRVSYEVSDPSEALKQARAVAVKDAKHKARELAAVAEVKLGDIVSISYPSGEGMPVPRARCMAAMAVDAVPKDVEFHESVTIQWQII